MITNEREAWLYVAQGFRNRAKRQLSLGLMQIKRAFTHKHEIFKIGMCVALENLARDGTIERVLASHMMDKLPSGHYFCASYGNGCNKYSKLYRALVAEKLAEECS